MLLFFIHSSIIDLKYKFIYKNVIVYSTE